MLIVGKLTMVRFRDDLTSPRKFIVFEYMRDDVMR